MSEKIKEKIVDLGESENTSPNLKDLEPIEGESVDLEQFDKKEVTLAKVDIMQVKSKFVEESAGGMQWVLKVSSEVLTTLGEGDDKIEFRASELLNLVQDKNGKLKGYPSGDGSNLQKFMKDIKVSDIQEIVGKKALVKAYGKEVDGNKRTYLKFRY